MALVGGVGDIKNGNLHCDLHLLVTDTLGRSEVYIYVADFAAEILENVSKDHDVPGKSFQKCCSESFMLYSCETNLKIFQIKRNGIYCNPPSTPQNICHRSRTMTTILYLQK